VRALHALQLYSQPGKADSENMAPPAWASHLGCTGNLALIFKSYLSVVFDT
jgi:hypothetical protein